MDDNNSLKAFFEKNADEINKTFRLSEEWKDDEETLIRFKTLFDVYETPKEACKNLSITEVILNELMYGYGVAAEIDRHIVYLKECNLVKKENRE